MTQAVSAKGVSLGVYLNETLTYFSEVKSVPEIGESPDKIDVTSLESEVKEYIKDIPDYSSDLEFTMNAIPTGGTDSNYDLIQRLDKDGTYKWQIAYPQLGVKVEIDGEWSWRMGGGEVSSAQEIILTIIPKSSMAWSALTGSNMLNVMNVSPIVEEVPGEVEE